MPEARFHRVSGMFLQYIMKNSASWREKSIYLLLQLVEIREPIVDRVSLARGVKHDSAGNGQDAIAMGQVRFSWRINFYNLNLFSSQCLQTAQNWLLEGMALRTIGAAKSQDAHSFPLPARRDLPIQRRGSQGELPLAFHEEASGPDDSGDKSDGQDQDARANKRI